MRCTKPVRAADQYQAGFPSPRAEGKRFRASAGRPASVRRRPTAPAGATELGPHELMEGFFAGPVMEDAEWDESDYAAPSLPADEF
ncbi:MAG TPA: hypothetical protein DEQ61_08740 [Streptomyces sp.]|nr:hypothetical protein [Streptomyces sp.]